MKTAVEHITDSAETAARTSVHPKGRRNEVRQLRKENRRLRHENRQLRAENRRLNDEILQLKQVFNTAAEQFDRMNARLARVETELEKQRAANKQLKTKCAKLEKELRKAQGNANKYASMLFGKKSEKLKPSDMELEDENSLGAGENSDSGEVDSPDTDTETDKPKDKKKSGAQKGHQGSGRKIPEDLPVETTVIELTPGETIHGIPAEQWIELNGKDEISFIIRKKTIWYVERIIRRKYTKPKGAGADVPAIITAPSPPKIIPRGKYGSEVWVDILIDKYQQHLPIQRQIFAAQQEGVNLIGGTVFGGLKTIFEMYLEPLYEQCIVELQQGVRWHADETRWYMLSDATKKLWYMWGFKSEKVTAFVLDPSRAASVPAATLLGIKDLDDITELVEITPEQLKILNVDHYSGYKALANMGLLILAWCWAHVRRDFTDIVKKFPDDKQLCGWAQQWVLKIAELYRINNKRIEHKPESPVFLEYDTKLRDAIDDMKKTVERELEADESQVQEARIAAMKSMKNHWHGLIVFIDNPEIPMDNNRMENAIRPTALGRNNYKTVAEWGGKLAACMYSIIETCKQNQINPKAYLQFYFDHAIKNKADMVPEKIRSLLPGSLSDAVIQQHDLRLKKF